MVRIPALAQTTSRRPNAATPLSTAFLSETEVPDVGLGCKDAAVKRLYLLDGLLKVGFGGRLVLDSWVITDVNRDDVGAFFRQPDCTRSPPSARRAGDEGNLPLDPSAACVLRFGNELRHCCRPAPGDPGVASHSAECRADVLHQQAGYFECREVATLRLLRPANYVVLAFGHPP